MELRSLVLLGLCVLAVSQCSVARHSMLKREAADDIFAADEASDDELQNDDFEQDRNQETKKPEPIGFQAKILTKPQVYEAPQGSDIRLECNVDPDNGTVVQWSKNADLLFMNNFRMISDDRYSLFPDSKDLLISNVSESDRGVFKCEVVQQVSIGIEHTLVILAPPSITRFTATNEGRVVEGQDLYLTCEVTGVPPPQIVWSRAVDNGNQRLGEQDGIFTQNSVHVKEVKREYSGKYYCYAFNSVGNNQAEVQVFVAGKPRVHVHRTVVNSAINVEAVLECSTKYDNNPHIRWYKDGVLIEDTSSSYIVSTRNAQSNLTVTPKSDSDFGTFTCEASNEHGKHNRSIALVQRPVLSPLSADDGKLLFTLHSHQPLVEIAAQLKSLEADSWNDTWKQFDIPLPSTSSHKYEVIYDLKDKHLAAGKYQAVVKARNDHSWSDMVDPVVVEIEAQPEYIQHASVYRGSADSIRPSSVILSTILMYLLVRML